MRRRTCDGSGYPVSVIVTHDRAHLDESATITVLRRYGEDHFPGVSKASVEIYNQNEHTDGRSEAEWLGDGYLFLGVGGGQFDDHPHERFPEDCVFTMILKTLGLYENRAWKKIADQVLHEDRHGGAHELHLANIIKQLHRRENLEGVLAIVDAIVMANYDAQASFIKAQTIVAQPTCQGTVQNHKNGRLYTVCVVQSDNEDVSRAARDKHGPNAILVVIRNSAGHIYISSGKRQGLYDLSALAARLRGREQQVREFERYITNQRQLEADGMVHGWYHQVEAAALFCGSLTQPHLPGSSLLFEEIIATALDFLAETNLRG